MLNQLILHRRFARRIQAAERGVSAVEAHERIGELVIVSELAFDFAVVHISRNRVVDVEQRYRSASYTRADVFAQRAVDVYFARYRNTAGSKTAVHIARLKSEFLRKCRPAFVCKYDVLACA